MSKFRLIFVVSFALFFASSVHAADIAVDADCSLTDAIIAANNDRAEGNCPAGRGADTIILSQDITLDGSLPKITSDITIEGNSYTISGNNRYRIFYNDGGALTINNLTMTKGYVEADLIRDEDGSLKASTTNSIGGAIYNANGTVSISDSVFSDNSAEYVGGAIYNDVELSISDSAFSHNSADIFGGAIYNTGELSITSSTFSRNSADDEGGAIENVGILSISDSAFSHNSAESGGAIANGGELSIVNSNFSDNVDSAIENVGILSIVSSTFSHNSAEYLGGAIYSWYGELSIVSSTFSHNTAGSQGDAIGNQSFSFIVSWDGQGGAIGNWRGELSISNSSFSNNSASSGGAIFNGSDNTLSITNSTFSDNSAEETGGAIDNGGELIIVSSTFSGNSAEWGGAILNDEGELSMVNSIIAGTAVACYSESRLRHNINNFIQDGSCSSDFSGDPKLGELVEPEDGSPAYFPLLAGSPAIDAADDAYCPETDQIGTERPQGAGCDIGAVEYGAP